MMRKIHHLLVASATVACCNAFAPPARHGRTDWIARVATEPLETLPAFVKELGNLGFLEMSSSSSNKKKDKILVLGTGFVGSEIVKQLDKLGIDVVTASKTAGNADYQIDLSSASAVQQVERMARGCTAVISTVGSIGTPNDRSTNAASGQAAVGAKRAGVQRFVFIGNEPRIRDLTHSVLPDYAAGKVQAETGIRREFPDSHVIIEPNFIYGGNELELNVPPRVPSDLGQVMEDVLGLYPLQALSNALPGIFGILLGAPVSRERVAAAAVNAALGTVSQPRLSSRQDIIVAASKRPKSRKKSQQTPAALRQQIYDLGDCEAQEPCLADAFSIMEEMETLNRRHPATDALLNGRWDFVFDVEADRGTTVVKQILNGNSPIKAIFNLEDLYMNIIDNCEVNIVITTKVLSLLEIPLVLKTSFAPDESLEDDSSGTCFFERFEGAELMGINLPIPDEWKQKRPLEFSYLDETMLIARGNGGEPHYLKRD